MTYFVPFTLSKLFKLNFPNHKYNLHNIVSLLLSYYYIVSTCIIKFANIYDTCTLIKILLWIPISFG